MGRKVLHLSKIRQRPGYTVTGTLCNRMTNSNDGMNVTTDESEVNCKFCLRAIKWEKEQGVTT